MTTDPGEFNGYRLDALLGRGASGSVYSAHRIDAIDADEPSDRGDGETNDTAIAIKLIPADNPAELSALRSEAQLLSNLRHPNIVPVFWFHEQDGRAGIGMGRIEGVALRRMLASGKTTPEGALLVLRGSLRALAAAHEHGIVHRDYKPENVLVTPAGTSHVIDFGIAAISGQAAQLAGTPAYAAPEQWDGAPASPASDVYAATAVFYECLTGERAFDGASMAQLREAHSHLPDEGPVPEALRSLIRRGLAVDPAERPPTAAAFCDELEAVAGSTHGREWATTGAVALAAGAVAAAAFVPTAAAAAGVSTAASAASTAASAARTSTPAWRAPLRWSKLQQRSAVTAAACGVLMVLLVLTTLTPQPLAAQLDSALGTGVPSSAWLPGQGGAGITANTIVTEPDGTRLQEVVLQAPATVSLDFNFCNTEAGCANSSNYDCVGNLFIPGFGGTVLESATIGSLGGAQPKSVIVAAGPNPATVLPVSADGTSGSALSAPPTVNANGSVSLSFSSPLKASLEDHTHSDGELCGYTQAQVTALDRSVGGSSFTDNTDAAVVVLIRWSAGGSKQALSLNGAPASTTPVLLNDVSSIAPPPMLQSDPQWANQRYMGVPLSTAGTVPTAVAMLLTAEGQPTTPPQAATELIAANVWKPGVGTTWPALEAFLGTVRGLPLTIDETDVRDGIDALSRGELLLVALTDTADGSTQQVVDVVTGYDAVHDRFSVLDPRVGATTLDWNVLLNSNPWLIAVERTPRS